MNYIFAALGGLIVVFVVLILQKQNRGHADYLLIGLNLALGAFMLSDVLVRWDLNSFTLLFQNSAPLLIFPLFLFYAMHFTHADRKIPWKWYGLFIPWVLMVLVSVVDHFVLHTYTTPEIVQHFHCQIFQTEFRIQIQLFRFYGG